MRAPLQLVAAAGARYAERTDEREHARRLIKQGKIEEANTPEQVEQRRRRQAYHQARAEIASEVAQMAAAAESAAPAPPAWFAARGQERIIGRSNLVSVSYFDRARLASRTVGRVVIRALRAGRIEGYGTGFLVSPRLLITNNHVIGSPDEARFSQVEFNYEEGGSGSALTPLIFDLEPDVFFATSPFEELDYTVVAVAEHTGDGTLLQSFGWNRLIGQTGKTQKGEYLNIIQHPEGRPKQLALRDNLLVDMLERHLQYETDTLRGSSGAPVYNDDWEVVALHHSGVPKVQDGRVLTVDGTAADQHTPDDEIQWVANEGIRVSRIVDDVGSLAGLSDQAQQLRAALLDPEARSPIEQLLVLPQMLDQRRPALGTDSARPTLASLAPLVSPDGAASITIPLHITVRLGVPPNLPAFPAFPAFPVFPVGPVMSPPSPGPGRAPGS